MLILVVDDERDLAEAIVGLLQEEGHPVIAANDLASAQRVFEDRSPDVVLVDYLLNGEPSEAWIATITARARVVIMSAAPAAGAHAAACNLHFVAKPFDADELLRSLVA